jgi:acyl-CoA reductase-like NAD-dependent aldehyde dehydrogenase
LLKSRQRRVFPRGPNLVTGRGDPIGEAISAHPDIDMVSYK